MNLELAEKVTIITGANGALGQSLCRSFLQEGARVACLVRDDAGKMGSLLEWTGRNRIARDAVSVYAVDLLSERSINDVLSDIMSHWNRIDILVNNAGHLVEKPFLVTEDDEWDSIYDVHLRAAVRLTRKVLKEMMRQKSGTIVNVSSVVAHTQGRGVSAYASAKAALKRLTEILAQEMGTKGIRVNAVAPGALDTPFSQPLKERLQELVVQKTPLGRFGNVEEVAHGVLFLASDVTGSFITGETLVIDGGLSLGLK